MNVILRTVYSEMDMFESLDQETNRILFSECPAGGL